RRVQLGPERHAGVGDVVQEGGQLGFDGLHRLAGERATFELQPAAVRVGRELAPAVDDGGVHGAGAEQRVARALGEAGGEAVDGDQHVAHVGDRVDALLRHRTVRGAAVNDDAVPGEALVGNGDGDVIAGRLGDDGGVGGDGPGHGVGAGRGELLV